MSSTKNTENVRTGTEMLQIHFAPPVMPAVDQELIRGNEIEEQARIQKLDRQTLARCKRMTASECNQFLELFPNLKEATKRLFNILEIVKTGNKQPYITQWFSSEKYTKQVLYKWNYIRENQGEYDQMREYSQDNLDACYYVLKYILSEDWLKKQNNRWTWLWKGNIPAYQGHAEEIF